MGITTKIMLALVIVAGLAGIVLGISYVPGKIQTKIDTVQKEAGDKVGKVNKDLSEVKTKYEQAAAELTTTKSDLTTANAEKAKLQPSIDTLNSRLTEAAKEALANKQLADDAVKQRDDAQKQLAAYQGFKKTAEEFQAIGVTADEIKAKLEELRKLKANKKANEGGTMLTGVSGIIRNVDPKLGFVTIDIGALKGAKKAALMTVTRNGQFVGQIKVREVSTNISICDIVKDMTKGEFKEGDVVAVKEF
ncbi:MAG: hypothetical protein EXS24_01900 [Pedosphaera sp.]|nr:hypothetical protein [Pedosphaera sp.]